MPAKTTQFIAPNVVLVSGEGTDDVVICTFSNGNLTRISVYRCGTNQYEEGILIHEGTYTEAFCRKHIEDFLAGKINFKYLLKSIQPFRHTQ